MVVGAAVETDAGDLAAAVVANQANLCWEFARMERRIAAWECLREDGDKGAYVSFVTTQEAERLAVRARRREAVRAGADLALERLVSRYGLSAAEEEVLVAALAFATSGGLRQALIRAQGNLLKSYLEVGFLADFLFPQETYAAELGWLYPDGVLLREGLLVLEVPRESGIAAPLLGQSLSVPHFVAAYVQGRAELDERLVSFGRYVAHAALVGEVVLPEETRRSLEAFMGGFPQAEGVLVLGERPWRLLVSGPQGCGKTVLVESLARSFGRPLLTVHLERLVGEGDARGLLGLVQSNAALHGAVLHLSMPETLLESDARWSGPLVALMESYGGLCVLETQRADRLDDSFESLIHFSIAVERPDADGREQLWLSMLPREVGLAADVALGELSVSYELSGGQIRAAVAWAVQRSLARGVAELRHADLEAGAQSQLRAKLEEFTEASRVKLTMAHLVLPSEAMTEVQEFLDACRHRAKVMYEWGFGKRLVTGKGLVALFAGEAGTGKTLCAEILANELDLRLQIVSIPKVVSKWVGETEKNIRKVFSHARAQNSMLLFDEADSLFAKRVKVERSQDHYQNMEVNMLLQEVERFDGIIIMTTNLEANIDRAFERRILFKIEFPSPEAAERERIWQTLIPQKTPVDESLDFEFLAERYELTGGQIKNAIVRAAYRCSAAGHGLNQEALELAAQQQASAAGRLAREVY